MRKVVLGIGNTLNRDEGLGVFALDALRGVVDPVDDLEFIDGGTLGLNLLTIVEDSSHLLILDAVDAGVSPGTVVELGRDEIPLFSGVRLSQHQITFQEVLGLARVRGHFPDKLHLIGVQPLDIEIGVGVSEAVETAMDEVVGRAKNMLQSWELTK